MNQQDPLEYSEFLDLMSGYRAGTLSPVDAHRVSRLLEQDPIFRKEAERDSLIAHAVATMPMDPLPRGLLEQSVSKAVGDASPERWFSLDSILLALGVGVAGAAVAHFLRERVDIFQNLGAWVGEALGVGLGSSLEMAIGVVFTTVMGAVVAAGVMAYRLIRSEE